MVPEECANISGDTCGGHVIRLGECNTGIAFDAHSYLYRMISPKSKSSSRCPALTAAAYRLARMFYRMLKYGVGYVDQGEAAYEERTVTGFCVTSNGALPNSASNSLRLIQAPHNRPLLEPSGLELLGSRQVKRAQTFL